MNFYQFASQNPWLTFFLAIIAGSVLVSVIHAIFGRKDCDCDCNSTDDEIE